MIEVLVVEWSEQMGKAIIDTLNSDPDIHALGLARDGYEALRKTRDYGPDVLLLNMGVPSLRGFEILRELEKINPVPIVLISELNDANTLKMTSAWIEKLAVEFVERPASEEELKQKAEEIIRKVKYASEAHLREILPEKKIQIKATSTKEKMIIIAASTGGPQAVSYILSSMPSGVPCPIVVIQHMPKIFTSSFANRLSESCRIKVKEAEQGEMLENGVAYIAPGDLNIEFEKRGSRVHILLTNGGKEGGFVPSADIAMRSAAEIYMDATIGLVLTGMGHDGTIGAKFIKRHHGTVIIESKKTSVVYGMPGSIFKSKYYDMILDLDDIPRALVQMLEV